MKIERVIHGETVEIELTPQELSDAAFEQEHLDDVEYVRNRLDPDSPSNEWMEVLSEKQKENAVEQIAYECRRRQNKYCLDESDAFDEAKNWFKKTVLPGILATE